MTQFLLFEKKIEKIEECKDDQAVRNVFADQKVWEHQKSNEVSHESRVPANDSSAFSEKNVSAIPG